MAIVICVGKTCLTGTDASLWRADFENSRVEKASVLCEENDYDVGRGISFG